MKKKIKSYSLEEYRCVNCVQWVQCQKERNPSRSSGLRQPDDYGCIQFSTTGEVKEVETESLPDD